MKQKYFKINKIFSEFNFLIDIFNYSKFQELLVLKQ